MSEVLDRVVATKEAAHEAARLAYANAQAIVADGKRAHIVCREHESDRSLQQNAFYWAACLPEIADQARINGEQYVVDAWHELFKRLFLGYEVKKLRVAGRKRTTVIRRLRSTTALKVKAMSEYLDKLQAFAATEYGVRFSVRDWYEHAGIERPTKWNTLRKSAEKRKARQPAGMAA